MLLQYKNGGVPLFFLFLLCLYLLSLVLLVLLTSVQILFIEDGSNIEAIAEAKGFRPDDVIHLPKK